jgi:hypothetical protein
MSKVT